MMRSNHHKLLLIPVLLLAFALRVWGLADHNIWWDEGIGVWLARMPLPESIRWTAGDVHPPLYYILLWGWREVAGEGEYAMRFPSVIFSFLTIPLIYRLGRNLGGNQTGILAALFLTTSRFAIWWAQEIRMYALAAMMSTGALWAATRMWQDRAYHRAKQAWIVLVLTTAGSLYTLYLAVTVAVVTNLGFTVAWWQRIKRGRRHHRMLARWIMAQLAVALLFLPWLAYALPRMHSWSSDAPFSPGFFVQLYTTMLAVGSPLDLAAQWPLTLLVLTGLGFSLALFGATLNRRRPYQIGGMAMLLAGLLLPPIVVLIISLPGLRFYFSRPLVPRYLLPLSACYYALLAWGVSHLWGERHLRRTAGSWLRRSAAVALTGVALFTAFLGLKSFYPGRARADDFATVSTVLEAHRRPQDSVVLYVDRDWPIFTAHYAGPRHDLPYGANLSDPAEVAARLPPLWEQYDALWLVTTPEALQADPDQAVVEWLEAHAVASEKVVNGANSLTFYARTAERADLFHELAPGQLAPGELNTAFGLVGAKIPLPRYRTGDTLHLSLYWTTPPPNGTRVVIEGDERFEHSVAPVPTRGTTVRTQIDVPLPPDLNGGLYRISIDAPGFDSVYVGKFTLVQRTTGTDITSAAIPHPVNYRLGDAIHLIGYALPLGEEGVEAGARIPLTLYWQADSPVAERYKVFTHLLGETYNAQSGNFLWGQQDNEPLNGQGQTTRWTPGNVIIDTYVIPVDANAPAGTYVLEVGMYGLVDGERLPVEGPEGAAADRAIRLATIDVYQP